MLLKINLATRTYVDATRLNVLFIFLALLLLLGLVLNVRAIATNRGEVEKVSREIGILEGKNKGTIGERDYQTILTRIATANAIIARKTYDWLALLDKLEIVVPDGVAVTGIQPDPSSNGLKLTGVAGNFSGLRRFVENLEDTRYFTEVYLLGQNETKIGTNQAGITFSITCKVALK